MGAVNAALLPVRRLFVVDVARYIARNCWLYMRLTTSFSGRPRRLKLSLPASSRSTLSMALLCIRCRQTARTAQALASAAARKLRAGSDNRARFLEHPWTLHC
jgi:hypothetical protein